MIFLYIKDYIFDRDADVGRDVAYAMLDTAYGMKFNTPTPVTLKNEYGKPYFADGSCHFSISHGKGLCAVLLTDEGECGVDIEPEIEENRARKIDTRFLSDGLPVHPFDGDVELKTELSCGQKGEQSAAVKIQELAVGCMDELPITAKWTFLEAVLKMSGEGFAAFSKRLEIADSASTKTLLFAGEKKTFYVTLAIKTAK